MSQRSSDLAAKSSRRLRCDLQVIESLEIWSHNLQSWPRSLAPSLQSLRGLALKACNSLRYGAPLVSNVHEIRAHTCVQSCSLARFSLHDPHCQGMCNLDSYVIPIMIPLASWKFGPEPKCWTCVHVQSVTSMMHERCSVNMKWVAQLFELVEGKTRHNTSRAQSHSACSRL